MTGGSSCFKHDRKVNKGNFHDMKFSSTGSRRRHGHRKEIPRSVSDMLSDLFLYGDENCVEGFDLTEKPDLWRAAFDNPVEFIKYCRKRLDHEKELLERSRVLENDIAQCIKQWNGNSEKHAKSLEDLFQVQNTNDKLQTIIMEERTNCQHLIGVNHQLESERQMMSRKYQAALLLGKVNEKSVDHLLEKNPKAVSLADRMSSLGEEIKKCGSSRTFKWSDPVVMSEKIGRLQFYIDDLQKQHREEVAVLKDILSQQDLKCESIEKQYKFALERKTNSVAELQDFLTGVLQENLNLRNELLQRDDMFLQMKMEEVKSSSLKPSRIVQGPMPCDVLRPCLYDDTEAAVNEKDLKVRLSKAEEEVLQKTDILKEAVTNITLLQRKCKRLEQDNTVLKKSLKGRVSALKSRTQMLERRATQTDVRRKFDNEGFTADVAILKQMLLSLQKGVQKFGRVYGQIMKEKRAPTKKYEAQLDDLIIGHNDERFKKWLQHYDPGTAHMSMSVWCDYFERKLDRLNTMRLNHQLSRKHQPGEVDAYSVEEIDNMVGKAGKLRGQRKTQKKQPAENKQKIKVADGEMKIFFEHLAKGDDDRPFWEDEKSPTTTDYGGGDNETQGDTNGAGYQVPPKAGKD